MRGSPFEGKHTRNPWTFRVQENSGNPSSRFLVEIDEERRSQVLQILQNLSNNEEKHQEKSWIASSTPDPRHTVVINSHGLHRSIPNEFGIRLPLGNHLQVDIQRPPNPHQDNHECTRTSIRIPLRSCKTSRTTTLDHIRSRLKIHIKILA